MNANITADRALPVQHAAAGSIGSMQGRRGDAGSADRILGLGGLRAVAIISVLVFHLRPDLLRGGFLGVDVFFVISGFLITTLLLREIMARGRLNLVRFWVRRARRLVPALVLVVLVSVVLGLIVGDDLLVDIRRQVLGALTFSNNWWEIGAGSSYFTHTAPQLFITFWSLAVEEQFYLLWPLVLAFVMAVTSTTRARVLLVLALGVVSVMLMALLVGPTSITRVYYGTDTHAFGLLLGAALALGLNPADGDLRAPVAWSRVRVPAAALAALVLGALFVVLDGESTIAYRGGIALASLATAVLVAALATAPSPSDPLARLFEWRPFAWIGERSYGIYLWHWPVLLITLAILPASLPDSTMGWVANGVALAVTIAAAALSYRFLEMPVRRDGFRASARRVLVALRRPALTSARVGAVVLLAMVGTFGVALAVAPDQSSVEEQIAAAEEALQDTSAPPSDDASVEPSAENEPSEQAPPAEETVAEEGSAESEPGGLPAGDRISSFGDSMLYVASPALGADLPGIAIDAESNRQWPQVRDAVVAAVAAGTVRDYVVIAAGTNAGLQDPAPLRETLDALGPDRSVVLVNLYHGSSWIEESNDNMASVAQEHPNVVVADWYGTITENLDQLQPDGIHPDMQGMHLFSEVVIRALERAPAPGSS